MMLLSALPGAACAWGDEGHAVTALVAKHFLSPDVDRRVSRLLAEDNSGLSAMDIASEASWADRYRDSDRNGSQEHYRQTRAWHYIDIELDGPSLSAACFGFPALPAGADASHGPADDCIVDKINEFIGEMKSPATSEPERATALRFLLHLVGDLHQPLHAGDDHDRGGNDRKVIAPGLGPGNLHRYWDTEFVEALGRDPAAVARELVAEITPEEVREWSNGDVAAWAEESFAVARYSAYGGLPPANSQGIVELTPAYVSEASNTVAEQLSKAGVRLAYLLNGALSGN